MFYSERPERILKILEEKEAVTTRYLAKALNVSEPTVRRDLKYLEERALIKRTFGGAVLRQASNREIPLSLREHENTHGKDRIAQQAVSYVRDGQVLFLDASSTTSCLIKYLSGFSDLAVITNSPKHSMALAQQDIQVFCTGGLLLKDSIAYVGSYAEELIKRFHADLFFFSCRGLTTDGILSDSSVEESDLRRVMLEHSEKHIMLCTGDKIGKRYMYTLCQSDELDGILTDAELPAGIALRK